MKSEIKKLLFAISVILLKVGGKLAVVAAKLAKMFKVGKVGLAAASLASYSYLYTWQFALLIMVAIGWHECGHVWAMRRRGIPTKGFYFIPLIGGAAVAEKEFGSDEAESFVAIMGPVWGLALVVVAMAGYLVTGHPYFGAAAAWMSLLNLLNLLPINPLDGGRILKSIGFSIHSRLGIIIMVLGLVAGFVAMIWLKSGLFALIICVGGAELYLELNKRRVRKYTPLTERAKAKFRRKKFAEHYAKALKGQAIDFLEEDPEAGMALVPANETWTDDAYRRRFEEKFGPTLADHVCHDVEEMLAGEERWRYRHRPENQAALRLENIEALIKVVAGCPETEHAKKIMSQLPAVISQAVQAKTPLTTEQLTELGRVVAATYDAEHSRRPSMTKRELVASIVLYVLVVALLFGAVELLHGLPGVDIIHTFLAG